MCPWDGRTVASFKVRDQIPATYQDDECSDGEEFDVTLELIWVTFTPTEDFVSEVREDQEQGQADPAPRRAQEKPGPRRRRRSGPMICSPNI